MATGFGATSWIDPAIGQRYADLTNKLYLQFLLSVWPTALEELGISNPGERRASQMNQAQALAAVPMKQAQALAAVHGQTQRKPR